MQKIFRILRNNKELGPFTLQEAISQSLTTNDLIWVDGQSAGWRHPDEIAAFRELPEFNRSAALSEENQEPAYHPASHTIRPQSVSLASAGYQAVSNAAPDTVTEPSEEELTAEKLERKAAEIYQRIQAYNQQSNEDQQGSQTKYARSLDDLKQEYADWLHKKNQKKSIYTKKNILIASGAVVCLALLFFIFGTQPDKKQDIAAHNSPKPYISNAVYPTNKNIVSKKPVEATPEVKKLNIPVSTASTNNIAVNGQTENKVPAERNKLSITPARDISVDRFIDSVENILAKQDVVSSSFHISGIKSHSNKKKEIKADPVELPEPKLEIAKPDNKLVPLSQQVNMNAKYMYDANQRLFGLEVTIQNKSIQILKKVAVDVFYYKRGGKLFDKETLYFSNIQPGNSFTLSTPGNRKAISAKFQIGQITGVMD